VPRGSGVARAGLAMPFFIKWDDVEFCLRGRTAGYPTMMLPGLGIWHMPWTAKATASDWRAFFLVSNRLVTAALHGPRSPIVLIMHIATHIAAHIVRMSYSSADLQLWAIEEFLKGPERLHDFQGLGLDPVNSRRRRFVDGTPQPLDALPHDDGARLTVAPGPSRARAATLLGQVVLRAFTTVAGPAESVPHLRAGEASWPTVGRLDSVVILSENRETGTLRQRDAWLACGGTDGRHVLESPGPLAPVPADLSVGRRVVELAGPVESGLDGWRGVHPATHGTRVSPCQSLPTRRGSSKPPAPFPG